MKNKYYVIKSFMNENKIKYYYVNRSIKKNEDIIHIGGILEVFIYKKLNYGFINLFEHNKYCSLHNGDETINFAQNSISFIFNLYPTLEYLEITDNRFIYCKNEKISLPDFYYIKYNFTWYESYLDAISTENSDDYIVSIKKIINKKLKKIITLSKDDFIKKYYSYLVKKSDKKIIYDIYHEGITLKEYLKLMFDNNLDCFYYYKLFNDVIGNRLQGLKWIIKKSSISKYNIKASIQKINQNIKNKNVDKLINQLKKVKLNEDNLKGGFMVL